MGWQLIQAYNVGDSITAAPAASITFSSIPQTYKSLKIVLSLRSDGANIATGIQFKLNNTTANSSKRDIQGNGASVTSSSASSATAESSNTVGASATANTFNNVEITIPNYSGSTNKVFSVDGVTENNAATAYQDLQAWLTTVTSGITSIVLAPNSGSFVFGSTATLYGLI